MPQDLIDILTDAMAPTTLAAAVVDIEGLDAPLPELRTIHAKLIKQIHALVGEAETERLLDYERLSGGPA